MITETTYAVAKIADVDAALLLDLNTEGKEWAIVRTSPISVKAWSFHTTEAMAKAAKRRWQSRDVVTR